MEDLYKFIFDEEKMEGVYSASLVEEPAIDIEMIHFSKEEKQEWLMASEEKRLVVSPVMIPNKKVWRNKLNGFVYADEETIERLQQNFAKQRYGNGSKIEHKTPVEGVYVSESWLVSDPSNDKANALGFKDLEKGTWMMSMKIEDEEIWNDYIKSGKVKGLSIDAMLGVRKENSNKQYFKKMNKKTVQDIVEMAIEKVAMASELKEFKISDEQSIYASELSLDAILTDAEGKALPNLEFEFEGKKYETDEMGAIKSIEEIAVEETLIEEMAEEIPAQSSDVEVKLADKEALVLELENKLAEKEAKISELEAEIVKLQADIVLKENEKIEMSKDTPASEGIKNVPLEDGDEVVTGLLAAVRKHK